MDARYSQIPPLASLGRDYSGGLRLRSVGMKGCAACPRAAGAQRTRADGSTKARFRGAGDPRMRGCDRRSQRAGRRYPAFLEVR